MNYNFLFTIGVNLVSWGVMLGVYKTKITNNEHEIKELKEETDRRLEALSERQNKTDTILQSINNNLTELNTKMDLLVKGKLAIGGE